MPQYMLRGSSTEHLSQYESKKEREKIHLQGFLPLLCPGVLCIRGRGWGGRGGKGIEVVERGNVGLVLG